MPHQFLSKDARSRNSFGIELQSKIDQIPLLYTFPVLSIGTAIGTFSLFAYYRKNQRCEVIWFPLIEPNRLSTKPNICLTIDM